MAKKKEISKAVYWSLIATGVISLLNIFGIQVPQQAHQASTVIIDTVEKIEGLSDGERVSITVNEGDVSEFVNEGDTTEDIR